MKSHSENCFPRYLPIHRIRVNKPKPRAEGFRRLFLLPRFARCGAFLSMALWLVTPQGHAQADTQPPVIGHMPDIRVVADEPGGAHVDFQPPEVQDDSGERVSIRFTPASGEFFPLGTTRVEFRATDTSGNAAMAHFQVEVNVPRLKWRRDGDRLVFSGPEGWLAEQTTDLTQGTWKPLGPVDGLAVPLPPMDDPLPPEPALFVRAKPPHKNWGEMPETAPETDAVRYVSTGLFRDWRESRDFDGNVHWPAKTGELLRQVPDDDESGMATLLPNGSENRWSSVATLPFEFWFHGKAYQNFCVTRGGLLTFSTGFAGQTHADTAQSVTFRGLSVDAPASLPNPELPDNTIACFQQVMSNPNLSQWRVMARTYGAKPNRQVWILFVQLTQNPITGESSQTRKALVLEETRNRIFMVDMASSSRRGPFVCGMQRNPSFATQLPAGNLVEMVGNSIEYKDNDYWIFTPYPRYSVRLGDSHPNYVSLDKTIHDFIDDNNIPGVSVALGIGGRMVYRKGFGFANVEEGRRMSTISRNAIGSTSKVFTAAGIFKLIEQGVLDPADYGQPVLDTPVFGDPSLLGTKKIIDSLFQGFVKGTHTTQDLQQIERITLRHLLSHTSSLASNGNDLAAANRFHGGNYVELTRENEIRWFLEDVGRVQLPDESSPAPGTAFSYANQGIALAGLLIENATGTSYESWMKQNVLSPMGITIMDRASFYEGGPIVDSYRYLRYNGGPPHITSKFNANTQFAPILMPRNYGTSIIYSPQGGWIATAHDMLRFMFGFDDVSTPTRPNVLGHALRRELLSVPFTSVLDLNGDPLADPFAHGWWFDKTNRAYSHNGDLPMGGSSYMGIFLNDGLSGFVDPVFSDDTVYVALSANTSGVGGALLPNLGAQLADLVLNLPKPPSGYDMMPD